MGSLNTKSSRGSPSIRPPSPSMSPTRPPLMPPLPSAAMPMLPAPLLSATPPPAPLALVSYTAETSSGVCRSSWRSPSSIAAAASLARAAG
eukprot:295132-Chlamydomonas_euryale.AAC.2